MDKELRHPRTPLLRQKNAFVLTREPTDAELLSGLLEPKSHFGRCCGKLGVQVIAANSPKAKGCVERNHSVDQDRLVKELRLKRISTIADAQVPLGNACLNDIFCFEYEQTVSNDYVIRFEKRLFQTAKSKA